jgi:hypothetical protein
VQGIAKDSLDDGEESAYWGRRYALRQAPAGGAGASVYPSTSEHDVPLFLEACKGVILTTGKYLNAIRECGAQLRRPLPPDVHIGAAHAGRQTDRQA